MSDKRLALAEMALGAAPPTVLLVMFAPAVANVAPRHLLPALLWLAGACGVVSLWIVLLRAVVGRPAFAGGRRWLLLAGLCAGCLVSAFFVANAPLGSASFLLVAAVIAPVPAAVHRSIALLAR